MGKPVDQVLAAKEAGEKKKAEAAAAAAQAAAGTPKTE
jgi:hypothetical protein